jgi:hypothetical protein
MSRHRRELVSGSDLVVVAWVEGISTVATDDERVWDRDVAHLVVLDTLKGPFFARVDVPYPAGLICPAPPRYETGETVLAFLQSGDRIADERRCTSYDEDCARLEELRGKWFTNSLSYGTLYPSPTELDVFRDRIAEAVALDERGPVAKAEREWLLRCAERSATRWHGLYRLAPAGDRVHFFYDRGGNAIEPLTAAEKERLADAFVKEPSLDVTLSMMLTVLAGVRRSDVDRTATAALETLLAREPLPYEIFDAAPLVVARWGTGAAPEIHLCGKKAEGSDETADDPVAADPIFDFFEGKCTAQDVRQAWAGVKERLSIPDVPRLEIERGRRRPVGATTPP